MFLNNAAPRAPLDDGPLMLGVATALLLRDIIACVHWHLAPLRAGQRESGALSLLAVSIVGAVISEVLMVIAGFPVVLLIGPLLLGVSAFWATARGLRARIRT